MMTVVVIFAIVIAVCLFIYAVDQIPMNPPLPVILKVMIAVVGAILVLHVAGVV